MNKIFNKLRQSESLHKENKASYIKAVAMMAIFTFVFLGAEYLYVNMISISVSGNKAVMAQNNALGISALGFLLYPVFCRLCKDKIYTVCDVFITAASVLLYFLHLPPSILQCNICFRDSTVSASRNFRQCGIL